MRVVILQHGDYGDAYRRFQDGGPETYRDQRHSVDFVASLAPEHEVTTMAVCHRIHDEVLASGLRSMLQNARQLDRPLVFEPPESSAGGILHVTHIFFAALAG